MNTDKLFFKVKKLLHKGDEIKNYKELCNILDLPVYGGDQKKAQLKELQRCCSYTNRGHSFIIDCIYGEPKEKEDKRHEGNNSIYINAIEAILLNYFIMQETSRCNFTKSQLWEMLGMVNNNYIEGRHNRQLLYDMQDIDIRVSQWSIDNFYNNCDNKLNSILRSALSSLQNRKLIDYETELVAVKYNSKNEKEYYVIKDDKEKETIMRIERETIDGLIGSTRADGKPTNIRDVYFKKIIDEYTKRRNRKLKRELGIDGIYTRYSVLCNTKYLKRGLQENEKYLKSILNSQVIDAVNSKAQKEYEKNEKDRRERKTSFFYPNYYTEIQRLLAIKLLCTDDEYINQFIEDTKLNQEFIELLG